MGYFQVNALKPPLILSTFCANTVCMIRSRKLPKDPNERTAEIVRLSTEEPTEDERSPIQQYLAEIGRRGGLKGGKARAASLSKRKRAMIAKKAAEVRWRKK